MILSNEQIKRIRGLLKENALPAKCVDFKLSKRNTWESDTGLVITDESVTSNGRDKTPMFFLYLSKSDQLSERTFLSGRSIAELTDQLTKENALRAIDLSKPDIMR